MRTLTLLSVAFLTAIAWAADVEVPTFARPAVTVIPFDDESPSTGAEVPPVPGMAFDPEAPMPWLSDGLPGILELAFERSGALNVVPRTEFAYALIKRRDVELGVDVPFAVINDVAKREGATHVVGGSFVKEGPALSFTVTVWEAGVETEGVSPDEAELERLHAEIEKLGEELALILADPALSQEEKETRAAEVNTGIAEVSARIAGIATAGVDAAALEELGRLAAELGVIMGDPELSWEEKQARAVEVEAAMEKTSARVTGPAASTGQSKEFAGKVEDLFSLVDAATAFVLTATDAGGTGLIRRQPTSDLEAFRWFAKGAGRYYTGEQIGFFLSATQKDDNFAEAHLMLAKAYLKEKNYASAKTSFEKSRALADYYPSAPTGLAAITRKEEPENAEAATYLFNEALAIDPSYAPVFDGRGGMYFAAADYQAAREAYEQFIAVWPTNKDGYYALGNTLWLLGKDSPQWKSLLRSAIDSYEESLAIDPDFAACHYNLASVYKIFEDVDNAILHYRRYIELEPDSPKRAEIEETIADWEAKYGPK